MSNSQINSSGTKGIQNNDSLSVLITFSYINFETCCSNLLVNGWYYYRKNSWWHTDKSSTLVFMNNHEMHIPTTLKIKMYFLASYILWHVNPLLYVITEISFCSSCKNSVCLYYRNGSKQIRFLNEFRKLNYFKILSNYLNLFPYAFKLSWYFCRLTAILHTIHVIGMFRRWNNVQSLNCLPIWDPFEFNYWCKINCKLNVVEYGMWAFTVVPY
jgi:hypothetical protein